MSINTTGGGAPLNATYITQTASPILTANQVLALLATGYMKVATTTGVITSQAIPIPITDGGTGSVDISTDQIILSNMVFA